jgi:hypothetical protein
VGSFPSIMTIEGHPENDELPMQNLLASVLSSQEYNNITHMILMQFPQAILALPYRPLPISRHKPAYRP